MLRIRTAAAAALLSLSAAVSAHATSTRPSAPISTPLAMGCPNTECVGGSMCDYGFGTTCMMPGPGMCHKSYCGQGGPDDE
jgi:hypothetical protein